MCVVCKAAWRYGVWVHHSDLWATETVCNATRWLHPQKNHVACHGHLISVPCNFRNVYIFFSAQLFNCNWLAHLCSDFLRQFTEHAVMVPIHLLLIQGHPNLFFCSKLPVLLILYPTNDYNPVFYLSENIILSGKISTHFHFITNPNWRFCCGLSAFQHYLW
jgi:hypothetical protein